MSIRRVVIPRASAGERQRWPSVADLCCPVCRRPVRAERPGYWRVADGPVPAWSHRDGRALCRIYTDDGARFAQPVRRSALASQRAARPECTRRPPGQGAERDFG